MIYNKPHYQIALTQLFGFGPIRTKQLLQSVENEEVIFNTPLKKLSQNTGISHDLLKKMNREEALKKAKKIFDDIQKNQIDYLFYTDPEYPRRLKQCEDAPLVLYMKGKMDFNNSRFVAVVGTRDASEYGKRI